MTEFKNKVFAQFEYTIFSPKPKNWIGLTVVNVRAVKNAVKLH